MTVTVSNLPFQFCLQDSASGATGFMFKSTKDCYLFDGIANTVTKITDIDYPGWNSYTPTSITRSGSTVTIVMPSAVNFPDKSTVTIAGCSQTEYNGAQTVTRVDSTHFTFQIATTPATPATGTITVTGGIDTVPGLAYLDGYFFVMDKAGTIYNSGLETPLVWNSLDFIQCEAEPDSGTAIAKWQNYIVGFGQWTTEFFYDAANATGSPLARIQNAAIQVGCANGFSVTQFDNKLVWLGNSREKGRGVYVLNGGFTPVRVSTPDVERILNADDLATVYAWGAGLAGHSLYVLSLGSSNVTLVYDFSSQVWSTFTRRKAGTAKAVSSLTQSNGVATAVCTAHGFSDGDEITIAGATPAGYNLTANISFADTNTFTYPVDSALTATASGAITATGSTESFFDLAYYVSAGGKDVVQGAADGIVYELLGTAYRDNGVSIDASVRTTLFDAGAARRKFVPSAEVIGDKVQAKALLRYSDDDYATWSKYRPIDLSAKRSRLSRLGSMSRRSFELRHTANTAFRVQALEIELE